MSKIFSVGLPKTGTMSLHQALRILGYQVSHYPISDAIPMLEEGRWEAIRALPYDALCNCGEWQFAALDRNLSGSRFIYLERDEEAWLKSIKKHLTYYALPERGSPPYMNRLEVFSVIAYDEDVMRTIFRAHKHAVQEYFAGRDNFTSLRVDEPGAFAKLCQFLGHPVQDRPFPALNRAVDRPEVTP